MIIEILVFTQTLHPGENETQGQLLCGVQFWIEKKSKIHACPIYQ